MQRALGGRGLLLASLLVFVIATTGAAADSLDWLGLPVVAREEVEGEITGELTGKVDGAPFTVYTMVSDDEDFGILSSAGWRVAGDEFVVDILGYRQKQTDRRGLITLHLRFDAEWNLLVDESYFYYYKSAIDPYRSPDGTVWVESVERIDEETMRVRGTFSGAAVEDWGDASVEIADGVFSVDFLPRQELF